MTEKTQYEKNLDRLKEMGLGYDAEEVAEQLANWRGSEDASKRLQVAVYGDDSDLDERVNDKDWHNII